MLISGLLKNLPAAIISVFMLGIFYLWFGLPTPVINQPPSLVVNQPANIPARVLSLKTIFVKAISAVAFEADSKARIFNQNGDEIRPIASLTKLMTAMVFLDTKPDWNKEIVIKKEDLQSGAKANIFAGDKIKIKDLFTAALIASDNSAITALIRSTGLSEKDFVAMMNNKAQALRLISLHFSDPTGLDVNNRGTAVTVAKLAAKALAHREITEALKKSNYSFSVANNVSREVKSTDQLIGQSLPLGAKMLIGKTGHLNEAGYCFAGVFEYKGKNIMIAVLGAPLDENRFSETIKILDWTLRAYLWNNK